MVWQSCMQWTSFDLWEDHGRSCFPIFFCSLLLWVYLGPKLRGDIEGWPLAVFAMESNLPEGTGTCTSFNAAKVINAKSNSFDFCQQMFVVLVVL